MDPANKSISRIKGITQLKILFASRGLFPYYYGGACRFSILLIEYLKNFPCKIDLIHPLDNQHREKRTFFDSSENVSEFHVEYGLSIYSYSKNIDKFIKGNNYDVAYSDGFALSRCLKNITYPVILNRHGYNWLQPQWYRDYLKFNPFSAVKEMSLIIPRRILEKYYVTKYDYLISLGGKLTDVLTKELKVPKERVIELPNGVDLEYLSSNNQRDFNEPRIPNSFLFVGGYQYRKGIYKLFQIFNELDPSIKLYVIGEGFKSRHKYLNQIDNLIKADNISILGMVSDEELIHWYNKVECLILPSLAEGLPTVILEAMACGLPVIATDTGAVSTAVSSKNGFVVKPNDGEDLKQSIIKFINLPLNRKQQMGTESRKIVQDKFLWINLVKEFYKTLEKIHSSDKVTISK